MCSHKPRIPTDTERTVRSHAQTMWGRPGSRRIVRKGSARERDELSQPNQHQACSNAPCFVLSLSERFMNAGPRKVRSTALRAASVVGRMPASLPHHMDGGERLVQATITVTRAATAIPATSTSQSPASNPSNRACSGVSAITRILHLMPE